MRQKLLAAAAVIALASAARADDTKPPSIADVKASVSKGKVTVEARITDETGVLQAICHHKNAQGGTEDSPMTKNDFDDTFKVTFAGDASTGYWIESTDLLGNGPSMLGSASSPMTASGKGEVKVAKNDKPPKEETAQPKEPAQPREPREPRQPSHHTTAKKEPTPPAIEHRKPAVQPAEGQAFTLRAKIHADGSPVAIALITYQPHGGAGMSTIKLNHGDGDSYDGAIPAAAAHGQVDYFVVAKNDAGQITKQGDGDNKTPYTITFKAGGAASTGPAVAAGPYQFTDNPPFRVQPGKPIHIRAQVVPSNDSDSVPDHVAILWRGNDAVDQMTDMSADQTGGWGGFSADLPAQDEGAIYYQVIACDAAVTKCGVDTGSKRKWHATSVASQQGGATPMPLEAVSSKGPSALPE